MLQFINIFNILVALHSILLNNYFNLPEWILMVFVATSTARTKKKLSIPMNHPANPVITFPHVPERHQKPCVMQRMYLNHIINWINLKRNAPKSFETLNPMNTTKHCEDSHLTNWSFDQSVSYTIIFCEPAFSFDLALKHSIFSMSLCNVTACTACEVNPLLSL